MQSEPFLEAYDIYAEVGGYTATTETIEGVEITETILEIETVTHADATRYCGLEIRPSDETSTGDTA